MKPAMPSYSNELESEYALWLANADHQDPGVLEALAEHYAADVHRLAQALLSGGGREAISDDDLRGLVQATFRQAGTHMASFRGHESVRSWLYGFTIHAPRRIRPPWRRRVQPVEVGSHTSVAEWLKRGIARLPQEQRLALVLRYAHRLSLAEIGAVLDSGQAGAQRLLLEARHKLILDIPAENAASPISQAHAIWSRQLNAALDGLLDDDWSTRDKLLDHLAECAACQATQDQLEMLDTALQQALPAMWVAPYLDPEEWKAYVFEFEEKQASQATAPVETAAVPPHPRLHSRLPLRRISVAEIVWVGGVLLVMLALARYFTSQDTHAGKSLFESKPENVPILGASPWLVRSLPADSDATGVSFMPYETSLSKDGHWLAFSVFVRRLIDGRPFEWSHVLLLHLDTGQVERISPLPPEITSSAGQEAWVNRAPVISSNSRWVVYTSNAPFAPDEERSRCTLGNTESYCLQIYLYDRQTGKTHRISQSAAGEPGNNHSYAPTLSPDGRWIAYWSAATNLVNDYTPSCYLVKSAGACSDIYLYDLISGRMLRVKVGRPLGSVAEMIGPEPLSITTNGIYLGLTIYAEDALARQLGMRQLSEAVIYDRQVDSFEFVNRSSYDQPGEGASANPSLSADGRYVAFASQANNLVAGDTNNQADVFLRDRWLGLTTIVSIAADGTPGNNDSGAFLPGIANEQSAINISADGRRVVFLSTADNLDKDNGFQCSTQGWFPCSQVYSHDQTDGSTQAVGSTRSIIAQQQLNALYLFPSLSADGRFASFLQQDLECPRAPLCSVVLVSDLQEERLRQAFSAYQLMANLLPDEGNSQQTSQVVSMAAPDILNDSVGRVNSLSFSPDGRLLAGGAADGSVSIWQMPDGRRIQYFRHHSLSVNSVAFSPDGSLLASAGSDGRVDIYRLSGESHLLSLEDIKVPVLSLAFSPDSKTLAVGGVGFAWNWDLSSDNFDILDFQEYPGQQINRVAFSPDGDLLAHASSDGTIWLRDPRDGQAILRLGDNEERILSLAFSPDGHWLASGSANGRVNLWWIEKGNPPETPEQSSSQTEPASAEQSDWVFENRLALLHRDWVTDMSFCPAGSILATASLDSGVHFWRMPSGERLVTPLETRWDQALSLAFAPDG